MSLFFIFNNLHFAIEMLGALVFLMAAWLAFDAVLVRRDFSSFSKLIGFSALTAWQVFHAFGFIADTLVYASWGVYFAGILLILANVIIESSRKRPEFKAILLVPSAGAFLIPFNIGATVGLVLIGLAAFRQYKIETKKILMPFWIGFTFLALGSLFLVFSTAGPPSILWTMGHLFEIAGFFTLAWWVWGYLQLRIREEMLLIFVSSTLLMAVIVSLTFSTILMNRIEDQAQRSIQTDAKVVDFAITSLREEASAKVRLIAARSDLNTALRENNFLELERILSALITEENLGFLSVGDKEGDILLRAHALTQKDDNVAGERAVKEALLGTSFVTVETSPSEKFSIRAASPLRAEGGEVIGFVVAGFPLDNAFADSVQRITGLQMSIFEGDTRVATTMLNPDGRTRSTGIKITDEKVLQEVLQQGEELSLSTGFLSRPFLASFLPIRNADGQVVGMISAAQAQQDLLETSLATNRLTLVVVIAIMLILITPIYLLTRRLAQETGG